MAGVAAPPVHQRRHRQEDRPEVEGCQRPDGGPLRVEGAGQRNPEAGQGKTFAR